MLCGKYKSTAASIIARQIPSEWCLFNFASIFSCQGDVINLGNRQLTVLHMPGHSRGSICLHDRENKLLFTGDVVYDGHMIDWLPYSHVSDYISSCERLVGLVDSEQVIVRVGIIVGVPSCYLIYFYRAPSASDNIGVLYISNLWFCLLFHRLTRSSQDTTTLLVRSGSIGWRPVTSAGLPRALASSPHLHGGLWLGWCSEQVTQAVPANRREEWKRNKHK